MATPAPSQFAALLRQSKFASFDPKIGQVYASFGGDAHRGNWGLKRPLPLRRRKATVTVRAVDSRQQQTEWKSAEQQHRWIQMWDEAGVSPRVPEGGPWSRRLGQLGGVQWDIDSEFGTSTRDGVQDDGGMAGALSDKSMAIPNIEAMSEKEFERYLEKLRELRPAFRDFVLSKKVPDWPVQSLWQQSANPSELHKHFLANQAHKAYNNNPDARVIEQQPQRYGGLTYAKVPPLQSRFLNKPAPGRALQLSSMSDVVASFAGSTVVLSKHRVDDLHPVDWETLGDANNEKGQGVVRNMRIQNARILDAPAVVAEKPGTLTSTRLLLGASVDPPEDRQHDQSNTNRPGSREYVGQQPQFMQTQMLRSPKKQGAVFETVDTVNLLGVLSNVVGAEQTRNS
ncbi:predicted protein [Postia placenta Mad-698-R]|uniref:Uncharacterized protein n=1 Tax=Rhodonia placenta TaxID=104341 RepID=A0A8H7P7M0_9APHY|nr:predicted protein [Postia placenta Mad-698-R]KAF9818641.1 hypothetical protein IEO21_02621 [Postia placenta]